MGIFEKGKIILTRFLSSRTNLTIFQCLLYFIVGYIMGEHLTWPKLGLMFVVMLLIQFITRTKAVADGMLFRQIMTDIDCDANELAEKMKREVDKVLKDTDRNDYN
jgi:hypothetical protein